jgi:hypothetical protein
MFALCPMAELIVTQREIKMIRDMLADCICHRCHLHYGGHAQADHFFFECPEDLPPEESN